ncbi:mitochondrial pyruvate carrier 1-like isoform X2 [Neodiprion virginianus]|uniref:Mitochondrial pyruvate carrier n=2 Tax=Neodiprion lecontei TaxID=441921 RepID=A0ABM3FSU7_NEOLC|nr:mitochondrial pyruvate carrier 1-like isoform X2 [Neodiprion fabricii]XP_046591075.1 mitochondrial pyruvate carrier 1 isoform X2 [Neodiprion lecontei]XP_046612011.1 mitochondrial pyruvate carrier 1-like isoform X2 [Neodiprion virginianus]
MSRYRIKIPIFNEEWRNYFLSTHFLAPALNWAIPISSILDMTKDPKYISGNMTVGGRPPSCSTDDGLLLWIPKKHANNAQLGIFIPSLIPPSALLPYALKW